MSAPFRICEIHSGIVEADGLTIGNDNSGEGHSMGQESESMHNHQTRRIPTIILLGGAMISTPLSAQMGPDVDAVAQDTFVVSDAEDICLACIEIVPVLYVGDLDGPGYIQESQWVTADDRGRIWITQPGGPKVYEPTGEFVGQVGRQGQGPLEFTAPSLIHRDEDGLIHIIDNGNARETRIREDLTLAEPLVRHLEESATQPE